MIVLIFLVLFSFPQQNKLIGNWEQTDVSKEGLRETLQVGYDSLTFHQEFFSKDNYIIKNGIIEISNDRNKVIVQSKIKIEKDTLRLISLDNKLNDKMVRLTNEGKNDIFGTWKGKTNGGVNTYFTFDNNESVTYKAVLDIKTYKYKISGDELTIYTPDSQRKLNYQINKNLLTLVYEDTSEKFHYKKTHTLIY
jgi:hypothetical protein